MTPPSEQSAAKSRSALSYFFRLILLVGCAVALAFQLGVASGPSGQAANGNKPSSRRYRSVGNSSYDVASAEFGGSVASTQLSTAIHAAAQYLVRATESDGRLVYRVQLNPKSSFRPRYNMLRHAGTMFSLVSYYERYESDEVLAALQKQSEFLKRKSFGVVDSQPQMLAVWSWPELTGAKPPVVAKLGGTGLGLVALCSLEKLAPGSTPKEDLRRLGRFLLYMQKDDGGFYSKFIPIAAGRSDQWTSLYYPGEAVLGLLMLYELDPSPEWLAAAAKGMAFLARSRQGLEVVEADHWALLATERLLPHHEQSGHLVTREELLEHAAQICRSILRERYEHQAKSPLYGSFSFDGRTCPTATRLEGLLAAQNFLSEQHLPDPASVEAAIERGVAFLLRTQVGNGPHVGGIPRAMKELSDEPEFLDFNRRATEVRIDYVQHTLSALLQIERKRSAELLK